MWLKKKQMRGSKLFISAVFLLTPFGVAILFRLLLPIIWCLEYIFSDSCNDQFIVFFHLIYLICLLIGFIFVYKLFIQHQNKLDKTPSFLINQGNDGLPIFLILCILSILFFTPLPVFQSGGSDAIMLMQEESKGATWFFSGALLTLSYPLYFLFFTDKSIRNKIIYFLFLIIISASAGKKGGILDFFTNLILIASIFMSFRRRFSFKIFLSALFLITLTIFFALYQYLQTIGFELNSSVVAQSLPILYNLTTGSYTSYLEYLHNFGGLQTAQLYSDNLGDYGTFKYFFNSYLKIIDPSLGINKSIGPFLNYQINGSDLPNGVNPTFFYELIFIYGNKYFGLASLPFVPIFFLFFVRIMKRLYSFLNSTKDVYTMSLYFFGLKFLLFFLNDTLNALRSLPFVLLLYFFRNMKFIKLAYFKKNDNITKFAE
jgi:hypothetical protein